jgi:hypothetical protein
MSSHRRSATAIVLAVLVVLSAMATLSCNIAAVPGRFTYVVKYEVTAEFTTNPPSNVNIQYEDDMGTQSPLAFTAPQFFEFTMSYDYSAPFDPEMAFATATFDVPSDKLFIKVIWKDYRTNFEEEVLASAEISGAAPGAVTLYGPPLPK